MNKTKLKIIKSAVSLFNKHGLSNVRNQDIAKKADISLSNFNYHFGTKEELVETVCDYMTTLLQEEVYGNQIILNKGNGLEILKKYFEFESKFKFFYLDTYNIISSYPKLKEPLKKQINEAIQIIKNLTYLSIGKGLMRPEPKEFPGLYDQLAQQIWINNHYLFSQSYIRDITNDHVLNGIKASFAINYPYLTEEGVKTYEEFISSIV